MKIRNWKYVLEIKNGEVIMCFTPLAKLCVACMFPFWLIRHAWRETHGAQNKRNKTAGSK
jgi:hypothetical protein